MISLSNFMRSPALKSLESRGSIFDRFEIKILEALLLLFFFTLALSTLVFRIGSVVNVQFLILSKLIVSAISLFLVLIIRRFILTKSFINVTKCEWIRSACILMIVIAGAVLAIVINRPDLDDSVYVPKALYYAENPKQLINYNVTWLSMDVRELKSGVLPNYELLQSALCVIFGGHFLFYYHILFPAIIGSLIIGSLFLAASVFHPSNKGIIIGLTLFILVSLLLGETHRTYGNLSFARAFQAKCMFLTVGVTSWVYFSIRYMVLRDVLSWITLLFLGIGMAGATTTALVFIPFLTVIILISYSIQEQGGLSINTFNIKKYLLYCAVTFPVVLMALDYRKYALQNLNIGAAINSGYPISFYGQLSLLLNPRIPVSLCFFLAAILVVVRYSRYRRFFLAWVLVLVGFLLNPYVAPYVMKYFTTENIYWRLFYLLPFPLIIIIAIAVFYDHCPFSRFSVSWITMISILSWAAFWGPTSIFRLENGTTFEWAKYKIDIQSYLVANEVMSISPQGPMLAPLEISSAILLLSSKFPQVVMRDDYMRLVIESSGNADEYEMRNSSVSYLYKGSKKDADRFAFERLINSEYRPKSVILLNDSANSSGAAHLLSAAGYLSMGVAKQDYLVFARFSS